MIAAPTRIYTGSTSKVVISIDLVKVVANPTRKKIANPNPIKVVILFIKFFTFFFQPIGNTNES